MQVEDTLPTSEIEFVGSFGMLCAQSLNISIKKLSLYRFCIKYH